VPANAVPVNSRPGHADAGDTSPHFTAKCPLPGGTNTLTVVTQDNRRQPDHETFSTVPPELAPTALSYDIMATH